MPLKLELKVKGQELVDVNTKVGKGTVEVTERLKLKMKGMQGDKKTKFELMVDPSFKDEFAIGEIVELNLRVPQVPMPKPKPPAEKKVQKAARELAGVH